MKIQIILLTLSLIMLESITVRAQSTFPSVTTNWPRTVEDVQLVISTTNSVVERGSSGVVMAVIRNGTTNAIGIFEMGRSIDYEVTLTNKEGKLYRLTSKPHRVTIANVTIDSGKMLTSTIPVTFGTNIEGGRYTLMASRSFSSSKGQFRMDSNPLEIEIK